jgi:hypothetical protein
MTLTPCIKCGVTDSGPCSDPSCVRGPIKCEACAAPVDADEADDLRCAESGDIICQKCRDDEEAYWRGLYEATPVSERNPEQYRRQMIDAGRGHLLPTV